MPRNLQQGERRRLAANRRLWLTFISADVEVIMKNPGFILLWLGSAAALVLAYLKMMHRQWFPAGFLLIIGASVILMSLWMLRSLNRLEVPTEPERSASTSAIQDEPITMQLNKQKVGETLLWAFGYMVAAICLVYFPDARGRWWLTYPGVLVLLALTALMMMTARDRKLDRIVADANGIEIRNKTLDTSFIEEDKPDLSPEEREDRQAMLHEKKVAWREVGAVKMVDVYVRKSTGRSHSTQFERRELVLFDHNGTEMMKLEDPLDPPQAYQRFLDSIPRWTKLTIQKVSKER